MGKQKVIFKSVLALSATLALMASEKEVVSAEENEQIIKDSEGDLNRLETQESLQESEESEELNDTQKIQLAAGVDEEGELILFGTLDPKTSYELTLESHEKIYPIKTDAAGFFYLVLPTLESDNFLVTIKDSETDTVVSESVNVEHVQTQKELLSSPEVKEYYNDSTLLGGYSESGVHIEVSGESIETEIITPLKEDGSFSIELPLQEAGTLLSVTALDKDGNRSEPTEVEVLEAEPKIEIEESAEITEKEDQQEPAEKVITDEDKNESIEQEPLELEEEPEQPVETTKPFQSNKILASTFSVQAEKKGTKYHYIKKGETLSSIASAYGVSLSQLITWNNIKNPNIVKIGEIISVNGTNVYSEINKENRTFSNTKEFIDYVAPLAEDIAEDHNLYTSIMIAQAAHESAWGKSALAVSGNNLFGMKGSYKGNSIVMLTWEETKSGDIIWIQDEFRLYPSFYESILDNADKLRNGLSWSPTYYKGAWVENTASHYDATEWLTGRYATDSKYNVKVNNTISAHNLEKYDKHIDIDNPITSQRYIEKTAKVNKKNMTIYSQPHGTASDQVVDNTSNYIGKEVTVTQEKVNNLGIWWLVHHNGKEIGWVNKTALITSEDILSTKETYYAAKIVKPWSINTHPYGTAGYKRIPNDNVYLNRTVTIIQEKVTGRSTYGLIELDGKEIGWIDITGLDKIHVSETKNTNYKAEIVKPWSINTQPWGIEGFRTISNYESYLGNTVDVIQEKTTQRSTYALIQINGKTIGWIDKSALNIKEILSTKDVRYAADVMKPLSINTHPFGTTGSKHAANGADYLGETVEVIQEKVTQTSTYALIKKGTKTLGWIDIKGLEKHNVLNVKDVNYEAQVVKPWSINTQPWGVDGYREITKSASYLGKTVKVTQEKVTSRSAYALLSIDGKEIGWMDKTGLNMYPTLSSRSVHYKAKVTRPWSINTQPWGSHGYKEVANGQAYLNQTVDVLEEKTTPKSIYALVSLNGKTLGWIDTTGLEAHKVLSTKDVHYAADVVKPWSINTQPWGTEGYKELSSTNQYVGDTVLVTQEKVTNRSTYALIEINGKQLGWIDVTGLKKHQVKITKDVHYTVKITKPWAVSTKPWGTEGFEDTLLGSSLVGETLNVIQEKKTDRSTYILLEKNGKTLGWIDNRGTQKDRQILSIKDTSYAADVVKPWSINTRPWGTKGYKFITSGEPYIGQTVDVIKEKVTKRSTYALIKVDGNVVGWIDKTGLNAHEMLSTKIVDYTAVIEQPWSINNLPWGVEGYRQVATGARYLGEKVRIVEEKKTIRSTYGLIEYNGNKLGWIDVNALKR